MRSFAISVTVFMLLLACVLACWPRSAASAQAAPNQKDSFLEVGNTYEFHHNHSGREASRVVKVVEAPRPDGWVKCTAGVGNIWINLNQVSAVMLSR